jgi:hypothetical protein
MNMKILLIQFVSIANVPQTKLSENGPDQKKGSVPSLKLILESMSGSFQTVHLSKTDPSDPSKQHNHHQQ